MIADQFGAWRIRPIGKLAWAVFCGNDHVFTCDTRKTARMIILLANSRALIAWKEGATCNE